MQAKVIDENLRVVTRINRPGIRFYDPDFAPFSIHGVYRNGDRYYRLPRERAERISPAILEMCGYTAGGRIRFKTNSPYVGIRTQLAEVYCVPFMTFIASHGFDVYADGEYIGALPPPLELEGEAYESVLTLGDRRMREITIDMPLYTNVSYVHIGLDETSDIEPASPYRDIKPIVYYGSSITHGCSASRPGTTYEAIISRALNVDYVNLGFGGSAKAEEEMARYVSELDTSLFVYDYDHNAPTSRYLAKTHERMFLIFRERHPDTPVLMISRPQTKYTPDRDPRYEIIRETVSKAIARGDRNVYLIDGRELLMPVGTDATIDGTHPTDHGFRLMADKIGDVIGKILKI